MNKCIKVILDKCNDLDWKEVNKILWEIQKMNFKACNEMMRMYYLWEKDKEEYIKLNGKKPNEKEMFGVCYDSVVDRKGKEIMNTFQTGNLSQTRQMIGLKFNNDLDKIKKGEVSIANYKTDIPIVIKNCNYIIKPLEKGYEVELRLFNREYQKYLKKELGTKVLKFKISKINGNEINILNKIISGEYKQSTAQLQQDKKKKKNRKWRLTIGFSFEPEKKPLDFNRILGIDLGIVKTATLSIWDDSYKKWDWINYNQSLIDGSELIHFRQKIYKRRQDIQRASKLYELNKGRCGHGRNTRTQAIEKLNGKVEDFKDTYNHKISRYIVDFAVKNNCGVIQMENLSGFSEQAEETFLKEWSYYDIQNKVKYKAEEVGIEVKLINPKYTSQRCSECGNIHKENRDCKKNQAEFKCITCGYSKNADINASKNIALPNIEKIIEQYIKENK